jgi:hypothetical protein
MPVLTLGYRCCDRKRPLYLKHSEVEGYAVLTRQQLGYADTDAIPLTTLRDISGLKINGIEFALAVRDGVQNFLRRGQSKEGSQRWMSP